MTATTATTREFRFGDDKVYQVVRFPFDFLRGNIRDCEDPECVDPDWFTIAQLRSKRLAKFNPLSLKNIFDQWLDSVEPKEDKTTIDSENSSDDETDASEAWTAENSNGNPEWWTVENDDDDAEEDDAEEDDAEEDDDNESWADESDLVKSEITH